MMMMMKKPVVLMTCILLVSTIVASQSSFGPKNCCFDFISKKLSKKMVVDYRYTDTRCAKPAVVFSMKRGSELCVKESVDWVRKIISYIESQNANSTTSAY